MNYAAFYPSLEQQHVAAGEALLHQLCDGNVQREVWLDGTNYRCDLAGTLPNGTVVYVETKAFDKNLTPYIDAVFQAASYADALKMPVFIGPVYGGAMELSVGRHDNALGAIHLMAGRLNVGYLCQNRWQQPYLLLRGQVVVDPHGPRAQFAQLWSYVQRFGSRQTKT